MAGEFELIAQHFVRPLRHTMLGAGDDCALVVVPEGQVLALSADMLVEGQHFFAGSDPYRLGYKSLAVNLSDLAAMGALPRWAMLSIALPDNSPHWLNAFSRGFFDLADRYGVDLIGGDTTRGPLTISVQIMGLLSPSTAIRRDRAAAGDDIWISGYPGEAALGLWHAQGKLQLDPALANHCRQRLDMPTPRVELGLALRDIASAALDVSDGLAQDLGHIAKGSGLMAVIFADQLPLPGTDVQLDLATWQRAQLTGGDDYELCFCAPPGQRRAIAALAQSLDLPLTCIGKMQPGHGVEVHDVGGQSLAFSLKGYDHFG